MTKMDKTPPLEPAVRNPNQMGAALLRFRRQEGWSQSEAGERSGVKQPTVSLIESGSSGTQMGTLFKLLAGLDLELVVRRRKKTASDLEA